jgi:carboxylesterase
MNHSVDRSRERYVSPTLDFRLFQHRLTARLLLWAALSLASGLALAFFGNPFWRGFGIQAAAWGLVDALIALLGRLQPARRKPAPGHPQEKLRRLLWINTLLDLLYITAGVVLTATANAIAMAASPGAGSATWHLPLPRALLCWPPPRALLRGHGLGIAAQGAFLFFFDLIHAQSVPPPAPDAAWQAFSGPEHQSFHFPAALPGRKGAGGPAALLVHGFPGTPAELRPLGLALQQAGWTARGILLPGFGSQIATLVDRRFEDWRSEVTRALAELRREHSPLLLVGFSLGGALALTAAGNGPPAGLVLLAPFWRLGSPLQRWVGLLLRPFLPRFFYPLKTMDLSAPAVRRGVAEFLPHLDLDDPAVTSELRRFGIPLSLIREVDRSGRRGYRAASAVDRPVLILQGRDDEVVRPENTRRLARRFPRAPVPVEVPGGHQLPDPAGPGWPEVVQETLAFAAALEARDA